MPDSPPPNNKHQLLWDRIKLIQSTSIQLSNRSSLGCSIKPECLEEPWQELVYTKVVQILIYLWTLHYTLWDHKLAVTSMHSYNCNTVVQHTRTSPFCTHRPYMCSCFCGIRSVQYVPSSLLVPKVHGHFSEVMFSRTMSLSTWNCTKCPMNSSKGWHGSVTLFNYLGIRSCQCYSVMACMAICSFRWSVWLYDAQMKSVFPKLTQSTFWPNWVKHTVLMLIVSTSI